MQAALIKLSRAQKPVLKGRGRVVRQEEFRRREIRVGEGSGVRKTKIHYALAWHYQGKKITSRL